MNRMYPLKSQGLSKGFQSHDVYDKQLDILDATRQYLDCNLQSMKDIARNDSAVKLYAWSAPGLSRPLFDHATKQDFTPVCKGANFGPSWSTHWFKVEIDIPDWGVDQYHFEFDAEAEGMVYDLKGEPLQGLTGGPNNDKRYEFKLPESWVISGRVQFWIEIGCNYRGGNSPGGHGPPVERSFELKLADLVAPNIQARALLIDFSIIKDCARLLPQNSWESHHAKNAGKEIMTTFRLGDQSSVLKCREIAKSFLGKHINSSQVYNHDGHALVTAVGNCHIDTAWLWPYDETRRKVARSWATQIDLMQRYPEYRFTASQAQQFEWLMDDYPLLLARVQQFVEKGQFEVIGGSWVESDGNLPTGEALARQFLYGQRFFEQHFGKTCKVFWLPDTFGYCAQLPQICRLAGMDYGFTQKLSWNSVNKFPHTTFNWVSLDGSQLLMHMAPADTYVGQCTVPEIQKCVSNHQSLDTNPSSLYLFGNGDGGGGPLPEMIERLRRIRGVSDNIGALPRVEVRATVEEFYERLALNSNEGSDLASWHGELYLELHRGTFTTEANTKLNNRRTEILMHDVELISTVASLTAAYQYPKQAIDDMWKKLLLNQFHDVLPGTSIEMVYTDVDRLYGEIYECGKAIIDEALKSLGTSTGGQYALNTLQWPIEQKKQSTSSLEKNGNGSYLLENERFHVEISNVGQIVSLIDHGREVVGKQGGCGTFVIYEDKPPYWQAWDTEIYSLDTRQEIRGTITDALVDNGNARVVVDCKISEHSSLRETVTLLHDRIDFSVTVNWHEPEVRFLKVEFPVNVSSTFASYETQFGVVQRPTHFNTSWDESRFEVCCHKFADLSEYDYGVSILNQSKYGFATHGNLMRLSLLRSSKEPNANSDMGTHEIQFAMLPHHSKLGMDVVKKAKIYNCPTIHVSKPVDLELIRVESGETIVLESIKRGEDDEGLGSFRARDGQKSIVFRLYESLGAHVESRLSISSLCGNIVSAVVTDILETKTIQQLKVVDRKILVKFEPFEIKTVKVDFQFQL